LPALTISECAASGASGAMKYVDDGCLSHVAVAALCQIFNKGVNKKVPDTGQSGDDKDCMVAHGEANPHASMASMTCTSYTSLQLAAMRAPAVIAHS
jgi:hypothetical protein